MLVYKHDPTIDFPAGFRDAEVSVNFCDTFAVVAITVLTVISHFRKRKVSTHGIVTLICM